MLRWDGGLRIIHPCGRVEWTGYWDADNELEVYGCTSRNTQEEAYRACASYDGMRRHDYAGPAKTFSQFLGYL
jgi:hypothetical protein